MLLNSKPKDTFFVNDINIMRNNDIVLLKHAPRSFNFL